MKINVKLINQFKKYGQDKVDDNKQCSLADNSSVKDFLDLLEIPAEKNKIVLVNGRNSDDDHRLEDGDKVVVYNLIAGG